MRRRSPADSISTLEAVGALERRLALDVAHLRFGLGDQEAAAERDLEIGAELGLELRPQIGSIRA